MRKYLSILIFLFFCLITSGIFAQNKLYFINPEKIDGNVISFKTKNHFNYIGLVYLKKNAAHYSLRARTYLEKNPIQDFELTSFKVKENINFDFVIDNSSLYLIYQTPENRIIYQKIDGIYSKPIFNPKKDLSHSQKVYSIPSIYKFRNFIYILYHKESEKNKMDIEICSSSDGVNFSAPLNLTESLGYAVFPKLFLLPDRLGIVFQGRPLVTQGKITFEIFYYQLTLQADQILVQQQLTQNIGDNFSVSGVVAENKIFVSWENRLNNWRIMYSIIDLKTGKMQFEPKILTSNFANYRKPRLTKFGDDILLFVQKVESRSDSLVYYFISPDGRHSNELETGNAVSDYMISRASSLSLFYLTDNENLFLKKSDNEAYMMNLTEDLKDKEVFGNKQISIGWEKIIDGSGISGIYYAFDREPDTIPDEISRIDSNSQSVGVYAPEDGIWYFHAFYEDNAGNRGKTLHKKIIVDSKIPLITQVDFSGNEILDLEKNMIGNTENISIKWNQDQEVEYYYYSVSVYPKYFEHKAQKTNEKQVLIPFLKPGRYYFYLQPVNRAGIKGDLKSVIFYVKEYSTSGQFFDPAMATVQKIIIRETVFVNLNLIPFRSYLDSGEKFYYVIPFWDLPVELKLKIVALGSLLFLFISVLYLILFIRHRNLLLRFRKLTARPEDKILKELEVFKEGEVAIQPGIGEKYINQMEDEKKVKYKDLITRVEGLDKEIHQLEKQIRQKSVYDQDSSMYNTQILLEKAKDLEQVISRDAGEEAHVIEEAESIEEAEEVAENIGSEEIEEAESFEEAEEIIEEAQEPQEIEEADVIEEAESIGGVEEAYEIKQFQEIKETKNPKEKFPEKIEEKKVSETQESKTSPKSAKEFHEKIRLTFKYSFLITILVMFTIGVESFISGYMSLKNSRENLSGENIKRAELAIQSLAVNAREPLRVTDIPLIIEAIVNNKAIENILYSQIIYRDLDINDAQNKWFFRDNTGAFNQFKDNKLIEKTLAELNAKQKAMITIEPKFEVENLTDKYTLYYPIVMIKDKNFKLTEKDFGQKFLGIARIDFSTAQILKLIEEQKNQILQISLLIAAVMIGFGIIGAILLSFTTVKPIKKLVEGVKLVAAGNLDYQNPITTKDEIGRLTFEFNKMTTQLKNAQDAIIKKKVLEEQFSIAEGIQRSLIPKSNLILNEIEVAGFYKAALGVGGDYFDFFNIDNERVGVIISDVSGKGIPAALMMVVIRTIFKTYIKRANITPKDIVTIINNVLAEDISNDMFASLFFFTFNKKTREVIFCNAGHGPFTYYSVNEKKVKTIISRTMPIGVMADNPNYTDQKVKMAKGDVILVFTDGVSEAMNLNRDEFSEEKMYEIVEGIPQLSAQEINQTIIHELDKFVGEAPQHDDISLIVAKVK